MQIINERLNLSAVTRSRLTVDLDLETTTESFRVDEEVGSLVDNSFDESKSVGGDRYRGVVSNGRQSSYVFYSNERSSRENLVLLNRIRQCIAGNVRMGCR